MMKHAPRRREAESGVIKRDAERTADEEEGALRGAVEIAEQQRAEDEHGQRTEARRSEKRFLGVEKCWMRQLTWRSPEILWRL